MSSHNRLLGGALRDDTKNRCVADYDPEGLTLRTKQIITSHDPGGCHLLKRTTDAHDLEGLLTARVSIPCYESHSNSLFPQKK